MKLKWSWHRGLACWLHGYRKRDGSMEPLTHQEACDFVASFRKLCVSPPGPPVMPPDFVFVYGDGTEVNVP